MIEKRDADRVLRSSAVVSYLVEKPLPTQVIARPMKGGVVVETHLAGIVHRQFFPRPASRDRAREISRGSRWVRMFAPSHLSAQEVLDETGEMLAIVDNEIDRIQNPLLRIVAQRWLRRLIVIFSLVRGGRALAAVQERRHEAS